MEWCDMIRYDMIYDLWLVVCDMWHVIYDRWSIMWCVICDMWYMDIYGMICDIWCDIIMISWLWFIFEKSVSGFLWQTGGFPKSKCCFFLPDSPEAPHPEIHAALHVFCISELVHVLNGPKATKEEKKQGQTGQTDQLGWHRHSWGPILRDTINFLSVLEKKDTVTTSKYTDLQITTGICLYLRVVWPALHRLKSSYRTTRCHPLRVIVQFSPQHRTGERPVCREAPNGFAPFYTPNFQTTAGVHHFYPFCTILHHFCWGKNKLKPVMWNHVPTVKSLNRALHERGASKRPKSLSLHPENNFSCPETDVPRDFFAPFPQNK